VNCPICDFDWRNKLPSIYAQPGSYVPVMFTCPNRHCRLRFIMIYQAAAVPRPHWKIVRVARCLGRTEAALRTTLINIPELSRETIEYFIALNQQHPTSP
jgi:hypothetical protein